MKFTFVKTQLVKCPAVKGWYLKLDLADEDKVDFVQMHIHNMAAKRFNADPHLKDGLEKGDFYATVMEPSYFSAAWKIMLDNFKYKTGGTILVNKLGGVMALDSHVSILDEVEEEKLVFPVEKEVSKDFRSEYEKITISKWKLHWYISSSFDRKFDKYNALDSALTEAKKFVPEKMITIIENPVTLGEGD